MSKHKKYVPKHRDVAPATLAPKKVLHTSVVFATVAVGTTGAAVSVGLLGQGSTPPASAAAEIDLSSVSGVNGGEIQRDPVVSRSDRRDAGATKVAAIAATGTIANGFTRTEDIRDQDPRSIAKALMGEFGFSASSQFGCLDRLWTRESNWRINADNPSSSAYGIPQALPGSKMSSAGSDWATNPVTQITWGLGYIQDRYGSPCGAWGHSERRGWY